MKLPSLIPLLCCLMLYGQSNAEEFSCEQIKEKKVRERCMKERKTNHADLSKEREQNKQNELNAKKDTDDFVKKAKNALIEDFKDPLSAQFTDFKVKMTAPRSLCGKVNGKNSYGGYVGAKPFYVLEIGNHLMFKIIDAPKPERSAQLEKLAQEAYDAELSIFQLTCEGGVSYVTP